MYSGLSTSIVSTQQERALSGSKNLLLHVSKLRVAASLWRRSRKSVGNTAMNTPSIREIAFWFEAYLDEKYPASFGLLVRDRIAHAFAEIEEYALMQHVESNARLLKPTTQQE